ncbi:putative integral membrane protein [Elaphomyces granulatus]
MGSRGRQTLNIGIIFTSLATFTVAIRIYTRMHLVKHMGLDDLTILVSLVFSLGLLGSLVGEVMNGMGVHLADIPPNILTKQLIWFYVSIPLYQTSLCSAKASVSFQYLRVFPITRIRILCYIIIGALGAFALAAIITSIVTCMPVSKFWNPAQPGYCLNREAMWFSHSAFHILTDVVLLILPMPVINSLQLPKRQKYALMLIFALGSFVCVTSILRLHSVQMIAVSKDSTYDNVGAASWLAVECNVAIICASLPSLKVLISKMLPRIISSDSSRRARSQTKLSSSGGEGLEYPLDQWNNSGKRSIDCYGPSGSDIQKHSNGITAMTVLSQESVTRSEDSSTRELVVEDSR